jgi:hypothetical protein
MTLPLTKEILAATYEFCRSLPPFCRWKLPPAEMVNFVLSNSVKHYGQYWFDGERDCIEISTKSIGFVPLLVQVMQHEIIHMKQRMVGQAPKKGGPHYHNAAFRKDADRVCKLHGWDPKAF